MAMHYYTVMYFHQNLYNICLYYVLNKGKAMQNSNSTNYVHAHLLSFTFQRSM